MVEGCVCVCVRLLVLFLNRSIDRIPRSLTSRDFHIRVEIVLIARIGRCGVGKSLLACDFGLQ